MITSAKFWTKTKSLALLELELVVQIQPRQMVFQVCLRQRDKALALLAREGLDPTPGSEGKLQANLKELEEIP